MREFSARKALRDFVKSVRRACGERAGVPHPHHVKISQQQDFTAVCSSQEGSKSPWLPWSYHVIKCAFYARVCLGMMCVWPVMYVCVCVCFVCMCVCVCVCVCVFVCVHGMSECVCTCVRVLKHVARTLRVVARWPSLALLQGIFVQAHISCLHILPRHHCLSR